MGSVGKTVRRSDRLDRLDREAQRGESGRAEVVEREGSRRLVARTDWQDGVACVSFSVFDGTETDETTVAR
jgi:hypothetical protein